MYNQVYYVVFMCLFAGFQIVNKSDLRLISFQCSFHLTRMGLNAWTREGKDREADDSLGSTHLSGITMIVENDSFG